MNWKTIEETPPNELVEVCDEKGNMAFAYPTFYPFKTEHVRGKWTDEVIPCEKYWDGGWMIVAKGFSNNVENIIKWRKT